MFIPLNTLYGEFKPVDTNHEEFIPLSLPYREFIPALDPMSRQLSNYRACSVRKFIQLGNNNGEFISVAPLNLFTQQLINKYSWYSCISNE